MPEGVPLGELVPVVLGDFESVPDEDTERVALKLRVTVRLKVAG